MLVVTKQLTIQVQTAWHLAPDFRAVDYNSCCAVFLFKIFRHCLVNDIS